ncbi:MAG: hypothetical protein Q9169_003861 [Polycauliona sp. 2 TL-2023]
MLPDRFLYTAAGLLSLSVITLAAPSPAEVDPPEQTQNTPALPTLDLSQYVRKDPTVGGDAGSYFISAEITKPTEQNPAGAIDGHTPGPVAVPNGEITFTYRNGEKEITIIVPSINSGTSVEEMDHRSLQIKGWPNDQSDFDPSQEKGCSVGEYMDSMNDYALERQPIGPKRRDIRCTM